MTWKGFAQNEARYSPVEPILWMVLHYRDDDNFLFFPCNIEAEVGAQIKLNIDMVRHSNNVS